MILFRYSKYINYLGVLLLLSLLILDFINLNKIKNSKSSLIHYLSWIIISATIIYLRNIELTIYSQLVLIFIFKTTILFLSLLKYRSFYVTKSFLGKIWILSLFLYLIELILNSTHTTAELCLKLAILTSIESILIIMFNNKLKIYQKNFLNIFWNKISKTNN